MTKMIWKQLRPASGSTPEARIVTFVLLLEEYLQDCPASSSASSCPAASTRQRQQLPEAGSVHFFDCCFNHFTSQQKLD